MTKKISEITTTESTAISDDDVFEGEQADGTSFKVAGSVLKASMFATGTYTPTLTNVTNIASSSANVTQYIRVGTMVVVAGTVNIDPTSTGAIELGMSLPIASTFANAFECGGTFGNQSVAGNSGNIKGDTTNNRAQFLANTPDAALRGYPFIFMYQIV